MSCRNSKSGSNKRATKYRNTNKHFGHIVRQEGIHREIMEGTVEDIRGRGKQITTWTDNIKELTGKKQVRRSYKNGTMQT